jgi:hypothetical protein
LVASNRTSRRTQVSNSNRRIIIAASAVELKEKQVYPEHLGELYLNLPNDTAMLASS